MSETEKTELEKYVHHLRYHDWYYQWSDDHRAWRKGDDSYHRLVSEQKKLDPDYKLWNEHAPEECRARAVENKNL